MNNILLLAIVGISAVVLIGGIVAYQFMQGNEQNNIAYLQDLEQEYRINYDAYSDETIQRCYIPGSTSPTLSDQEKKCDLAMKDRYGLNDDKYNKIDKSEIERQHDEALIQSELLK